MPIEEVARLRERIALDTALATDLSALYRIPTAVTWNRLEGRPRSDDLERPMRAEVRDPLWMLARQWQFGEFAGEDAGSPVKARLFAETTAVSRMKVRDGAWERYDPATPIAARVEGRAFEPDLMLSLAVGERLARRLAAKFGANHVVVTSFVASDYGFADVAAPDRTLPSLALQADRRTLDVRRALARRGIDGAAVLADTQSALRAGISPAAAFAAKRVTFGDAAPADIDAIATELARDWYGRLFPQPQAGEDAWSPSHLEYRFVLGVTNADGTRTDLPADRFAGGRFDWYALDAAPTAADAPAIETLPTEKRVVSFVPTPVRFYGEPSARWWEFEDTRVGFGLTTASKTDLVKLLLTEFGLAFSNDWFVIPFAARPGTLVETKGIVVTDNFGINTLVEPTAKRHRERGLAGTWGMWTLAQRDAPGTVDPRFLLAPTVAKSLESRPLDEVAFLRDEMANLVWGVESITSDPLGGGRDARATANALRGAIAAAYPTQPFADVPDVFAAYHLMGRVPENWIPLVSVRTKDAATATAFLQGAMPRVPPLEPVTDAAGPILAHNVVLPRGTILARDPVAAPNVINEEEILRGGTLVRRTFEQARWVDGSTHTWCGLEKHNGRGEGSSGLTFDSVILRKDAT
ncbi:MAG: hypothetical protein NVSMB19_23660 [Vulcanimicrobiaceae bacterium]